VTTGITNRQELLKKYTRGGEFLKAAISKFPPDKVMEWFETHGVALKIEEDLRVFPVSNDGHDVVGVFERLFSAANIEQHLLTSVKGIERAGSRFLLETNKGRHEADFVVITTGGNAYRQTGSTGDGYAFAASLGHTITPVGPSLNSFVLAEEWPKTLSGLSLEKAILKYKKTAVTGPLLFTHFGISGPVVFSLSSHIPYETISPKSPLKILLIPRAGRTFEDWEELFLNAISEQGKKQVKTLLHEFIP